MELERFIVTPMAALKFISEKRRLLAERLLGYFAGIVLPAGSPTAFKYSIVSDGMHSFSLKI